MTNINRWPRFSFPATSNQEVSTLGCPYLIIYITSHFAVVQSLSHVLLYAAPCTAACQASLSFTVSWNLFKLMFIELVMPYNHLVLYGPFLLLPSTFPSISVFSNESALHIRWPKYQSYSFSISLSNECSALIYIRIDWFDPPAVQGTLKSLLQHHNSKASILQSQHSLWCNTHIHTWLLEKP